MESVIEALGGNSFLVNQLSREVVHAKLTDSSQEAWPNWLGLNTALATARLQPPRVRVFNGGVKVSEDEYMAVRYDRRGNAFRMIDFPRLESLLRDGSGLVIDSLDEIDPLVRDAVEELERFTTDTVQANAYITWGTDSGFGPHWDDHDVIVVQLEGTKCWEIFGPSEPYPILKKQRDEERCPDIAIWSGTLTVGDVLHVPRGWWHNVTGTGAGSYHLTFGFTRRTLLDVARFVVDQLLDEPGMRQSLAIYNDTELERQREYIRAQAISRFESIDVNEYLSHHRASQPLRRRSSLPFAVAPNLAPDDCTIRRLTRNPFSIAVNENALVVEAGAKTLTFSLHYRSLLEHINALQNTTVDAAWKESRFTRKTFDAAVTELCRVGLIGLG